MKSISPELSITRLGVLHLLNPYKPEVLRMPGPCCKHRVLSGPCLTWKRQKKNDNHIFGSCISQSSFFMRRPQAGPFGWILVSGFQFWDSLTSLDSA